MPANSTMSGVQRVHPSLGHAVDRAAEIHVLPTGELGMEAGADLEEGADPAARPAHTRGRLGDPADDLEQRALPGAVATDDSERLAFPDDEVDVAERPDLARADPPACARRA